MTSLAISSPSAAVTPRDPYKERRPPYSEDAETAVLGAMLLDADAIMRASEHVDDTMFYREGPRDPVEARDPHVLTVLFAAQTSW